MAGILHDPAYLLGSSYSPQLTCFCWFVKHMLHRA